MSIRGVCHRATLYAVALILDRSEFEASSKYTDTIDIV